MSLQNKSYFSIKNVEQNQCVKDFINLTLDDNATMMRYKKDTKNIPNKKKIITVSK